MLEVPLAKNKLGEQLEVVTGLQNGWQVSSLDLPD